MSMTIETKTVKGTKGKTLGYELANFHYDEESRTIKWDAFPFYSPQGTVVDDTGNRYVEIQAGEISIIRDDSQDKIGQVVISLTGGLSYVEVRDGAEWPTYGFEQDGDVAAIIMIPADTSQPLTCQLKRVVEDE